MPFPPPPTRPQNLNQMDQQIRTEHLLYACVQHVMRGGGTEALVLVWTAQCLLAREWDRVYLCSRRKWALEKASQWMRERSWAFKHGPQIEGPQESCEKSSVRVLLFTFTVSEGPSAFKLTPRSVVHAISHALTLPIFLRATLSSFF